MFSIIKKGIATLRSKGIKDSLYWFYFGYFRVNRFFLFRKELDHTFPEVPQRDDIWIKQVSLQELKEIRQNQPNLPVEFYCDQYENSRTCFAGFIDGRITNIVWVFFSGDGSRFFNLKQNEAEVNYAVTLPEFRGLNLYPLTIKSIGNWLNENHYKWLYVANHDKNVNAIRAIGKCGFVKIGEIKHFSLWRPKWKGNS